MIVPSIDIVSGQAVQLVGGEKLAVEAGDPRVLMKKFAVAGEVAVIDIDAARGEGENTELIRELCSLGRVRVGGGIRDRATALRWLDSGAEKVIIGTAATEELLATLPHERVMVALDSKNNYIVTHGWRSDSDTTLEAAIERFRGLCQGFLITFVEREGQLAGTDLTRAARAVAKAGATKVTIAGGVTTPAEIAELDRIGADAQVGMALYTNQLDLADAITAPMISDRRDGLWPTVVTDERGTALGLTWSNLKSVRKSLATRQGVYHSRSRGLWVKGESSGATQELLQIDVDCDRDALKFVVRQSGPGFCHLNNRTCWGPDTGLGHLSRRLSDIATDSQSDSNTSKLIGDPDLLDAKLREEAAELAAETAPTRVAHEAADLIYLTLVKAAASGVTLSDIENILDARSKVVSRRPMTRKR